MDKSSTRTEIDLPARIIPPEIFVDAMGSRPHRRSSQNQSANSSSEWNLFWWAFLIALFMRVVKALKNKANKRSKKRNRNANANWQEVPPHYRDYQQYWEEEQ